MNGISLTFGSRKMILHSGGVVFLRDQNWYWLPRFKIGKWFPAIIKPQED